MAKDEESTPEPAPSSSKASTTTKDKHESKEDSTKITRQLIVSKEDSKPTNSKNNNSSSNNKKRKSSTSPKSSEKSNQKQQPKEDLKPTKTKNNNNTSKKRKSSSSPKEDSKATNTKKNNNNNNNNSKKRKSSSSPKSSEKSNQKQKPTKKKIKKEETKTTTTSTSTSSSSSTNNTTKKHNTIEYKLYENDKFCKFKICGKWYNVDSKHGCSITDRSNNGTCFECRDTASNKKDDPILLCDGEGCAREFHLSCIQTPEPLLEVPKGPFYCEDCDPLGTSGCLEEYFDALDELRSEFDSGYDFIHFLRCLHSKGLCAKKLLVKYNTVYNNNNSEDGDKKVNEVVRKKRWEERDATLNHLISRVTCLTVPKKSSSTSTTSNNVDDESSLFDLKDLPISELSRTKELHHAALGVPSSIAHQIHDNERKKRFNKIINHEDPKPSGMHAHEILQELKISEIYEEINNEEEDDISARNLVGKMVRLFCPISNQYHNGRIIDWRSSGLLTNISSPNNTSSSSSSTNSKVHDILNADTDILQSEFLVRFPAGFNGRKKTILKWLILEEHSIAVSMTIVNAIKDRGRGVNGWKPAQIVFRSVLELIPVSSYISNTGQFALAMFFADENHSYIDVDSEAINFFSKAFDHYKFHKLNSSASVKKSYLQGVLDFLVLAESLVEVELKEQKRTERWHKMMLFDNAHSNCFSIRSEYDIPPLEIQYRVDKDKKKEEQQQKQEQKQNKNNEDSRKMIKKEKNHKDELKEKEFSAENIIPQICPLVQQGLDRQKLLDHLTSIDDVDFNLDMIATIKCETTSSKADRIARLSLLDQYCSYNDFFDSTYCTKK